MSQVPTKAAQPRPTPDNPAPTLASMPLHAWLIGGGPNELAAKVTPDMLPSLRAYQTEAARITSGCDDPAFVLGHIVRLMAHYPPTASSARLDELRWDDWVEDLGDIPADLIEAGCRLWRSSGETWAPTPGRFLEKLKPMIDMRAALLRRINGVVEKVA